MSASSAGTGLIAMTKSGVTRYATTLAYRFVWYPRGWRSSVDPNWAGGGPGTPAGRRVLAARNAAAAGISVGSMFHFFNTASPIAGAVNEFAWNFAGGAANTKIRFFGCTPVSAGVSAPSRNWALPDPTIITYGPAVIPTYTLLTAETETNGTQLDVILRNPGTNASLAAIYVDDKLVREVVLSDFTAPGVANGSLGAIPLTFTGTSFRRVKVELCNQGVTFPGFNRQPGATMRASTESAGPKVMLVGDSWMSATGAIDNAGPPEWVGRFMGWRNVWRSSIGGTGYVNDSSGTRTALKDRWLNDIVAQAPDICIIAMGNNDSSTYDTQPATVRNAATAVWDGVRAALPNCRLVIVGPFFPKGPPSAVNPSHLLMDDDFTTLAAARGLSYISPLDEHWITGGGRENNHLGDGNADDFAWTDGAHLNGAGYRYVGRKLADALTALGVH